MAIKKKTNKSIWPCIELITGWNPIKSNINITIVFDAPVRMINCRCVIKFDLEGEENGS